MELTGAFSVTMFIAVSAIAMSYAWGMRGTNLGGEKAAVLPGAVMGTMIAVCSGSRFLLENAYLMSAIGAMGMYFGGHMSYMQSVGLTSNKFPPEAFKRGMAGLSVKGGVWFGVFGAVVGIFLSFLTGQCYNSLSAVLLLFGLMPVAIFIGERIFDRPFDAKKGIHPKLYFSVNRQDGIGVMIGVLTELTVFMAVCKDWASLALMAGCLITGGLGFPLAVQLHRRSRYPSKKGWIFLGKSVKKGLIDNWKIAECAFGAMAGIGFSVTFLLVMRLFPGYAASIAGISGLPQLAGGTALRIFPAVSAVLMVVAGLAPHVIKRPPTKEELDDRLSRGLMGHAEHEASMRSAGAAPSKRWLGFEKLFEDAERPVYCILPLCFMFLGSARTASLVSFYFMYYILAQQNIFVRFNEFKTIRLWRAWMLGLAAVILLLTFWGWAPGLLPVALLYGAFYEVITLVGHIAQNSHDRRGGPLVKDVGWIKAYGGRLTTHAWFLACIAVMTAFAAWVTLTQGLRVVIR